MERGRASRPPWLKSEPPSQLPVPACRQAKQEFLSWELSRNSGSGLLGRRLKYEETLHRVDFHTVGSITLTEIKSSH